MILDTVIPVLGANLIWQTLLLAIVVGLTFRVLPKHAAKTRYHIALVALFGSGLLCAAPFLPDLIPDLSIGLTPTPVEFSVSGSTPLPPEILATENVKISIEEVKSQFPVGTIILIIWITGIIISLVRLSRAALTAQNWARNARPQERLNQDALSKSVRIRRSADVSTPLVLGFFKPVVLVPEDFDLCLENPGTRAVLEHEIAHLIRGDLWTNLAQHLVLAVLWWCAPLYWINTQIGIEREKLCDDIAAQKTGTGRALANALVELVDSHPKQQPMLAIGIHPRAHNLAERIHRLCKETPMPKPSKRLLVTTSIAVPVLIGSLILAAPRAIAHSPVMSHSALSKMEDVSSLQYALFKATSLGRVKEVREILGMGVDPAFHLHGDGTPLILAAKLGNIEIADLLLSHGAKINRMTASDESALINAVKTNHLDMVEFLVQRGADVSLGQVSNPRHRPEWRSPLSTAQKHKRHQIAQYLQSQGAVADSRKQTPRRLAHGPIVEGRLTSKFGEMRKKYDGKMHKGIDIANTEGTPIFAPSDGTIVEVTNTYKGKKTWGHVVVMESPGGIETVFAHLKDSQVAAGDFVRRGTQIARLGNTGKSTGPHVHIQTHKNGKLVDPLTVWTTLAR